MRDKPGSRPKEERSGSILLLPLRHSRSSLATLSHQAQITQDHPFTPHLHPFLLPFNHLAQAQPRECGMPITVDP